MFDVYIKQAFLMVALFSGIPLAACSLVALVVAFVQAATQIQEQTITYLIRFSVLSAVLALTGGWMVGELVQFVQDVLGSIEQLGRLATT